jgi:hypothetical protein
MRVPHSSRTRRSAVLRLGRWAALPTGAALLGCANVETRSPPEKTATIAADTASPVPQQPAADTSRSSPVALPSGYSLTDTATWGTDLEEGQRAVLRRAGVLIDTVDLYFGVVAVGADSLVFLQVRTDSVPLHRLATPTYESSPAEHVFWTPASRRELRGLLPFFDSYFSSPMFASESAILYWGIAPRAPTNRLYAMRYDFRTARLDSIFLDREDPLATDYRYHLQTPQVQGNEVSFDGVVLDGTTWQVIRRKAPSR